MAGRDKKNKKFVRIIMIEAVILILLLAGFAISAIKSDKESDPDPVTGEQQGGEDNSQTLGKPTPIPTPSMSPEELQAIKEKEEQEKRAAESKEKVALAEKLAAMYDYDAAIKLLKGITGFEKDTKLQEYVKTYETQKSACVVWEDNTKISHIFFHSLIVDTKKAFGPGSSQLVGYNKYMTTVSEFKKILDQMYEKGYVLISMHDMAKMEKQEDKTEKMVQGEILLPPGKIPFVLSQDDVNYYKYMEGDGFADRLVIGEDGKPTCEYIKEDGTVVTGEFDILPIVDKFIEEHPDFSYRGAKGILAVTGYEGALGYDTGWHQYDLSNESDQKKLLEEQEKAKAVAEAIKADGWEFASHSYTHTSMTTNSISKLIYDTDKWEDEVEPLLGGTDLYIYPFGADICDWRGYSGEKYDYLYKAGFRYFCNVDSAQYWVQIKDQYVRMGRINADGERMYHSPEKLSHFFDVDYVFDPGRPTPVPR